MAAGRRTARWLVVAAILLALAWWLYRLIEEQAELGPDRDAGQLLLPLLSFMLVVLVLALAGVLIRNLVRLIVDRKRGILGSRLRTKLVFFFLALVLLPATVLFSGSAQVIKQTVEAILRTPLEDLKRESEEIVEQWSEYFRATALYRARAIAEEIRRDGLLAAPRRGELQQLLGRWSLQEETQVVRVTAGAQVLATAGGTDGALQPERRDQVERHLHEISRQVGESGRAETRIDYLGEGLLAHAAVPLEGGIEDRAQTPAVVAVGIVLPTRLAGILEGFSAATQAYSQFRAKRRELVRLYLTLIGLIFLVTLFIATWIGFYVSRRITVPIQELAAASREISAGNLDVRVRTDVGDEMALLVDAFNEMAAELQENRAVITRSTADLRRSNRALGERRRYIETLVANLSTAVISLDPAGKVTTANPAVAAILGVELAVGDNAAKALELHGLEPLAQLLGPASLPAGEGIRRELEIRRPPGGVLHVAVQISPLRGGGGEDLGTLVMVEDLTELLRAQKAAAWREVARRIAHEIKNPLTPIQLAAQRLRKKFAENAEDLHTVVPAAAASIEREVGALKQLVDEFSRFARMPELAPQEVEISRVVESVLELYEGGPELRFEVALDPALGPVRLDPEQIRRVLINLIDNARSAMGGKGTVRISARPAAGPGSVRLEVADTGPGIPAADRDKMFSPYFSTKKRGTGLGLAIVHKVVTDHRGTIQVEENDPHGARFVIELPA